MGSSYALRQNTMLNGKYVLDSVIGTGGFGITYKAQDIQSNQTVAIKELYPRQIVTRLGDGATVVVVDPSEMNSFSHSRDRFAEEAMVLYKLRGMDNVVDVIDYFEQNGTSYFVMKFLDGTTLKDLAIRNNGRLKWDNLKTIISQVGGTLSKLHSINLYHRDISPDNIFYTKQMQAVLIDFGNAKVLSNPNPEGVSIFVKKGFAPLEQYSSNKPQGPYTDVYSLAATMYFLLAGQKLPEPFDRVNGVGYRHLAELGYPIQLSVGLDKALELYPEDRTQNVDEFMWDIGISGPDLTPPPPPPPNTAFMVVIDVYMGDSISSYILPENTTLTIGKSPVACNIVVDINYVSRRHLEIMYDSISDSIYARDCASTNGTYIGSTYSRMKKDQIMVMPFDTDMFLGGMGCHIRVRKVYDQLQYNNGLYMENSFYE